MTVYRWLITRLRVKNGSTDQACPGISRHQVWNPVVSNGTSNEAGQLTGWTEGYITLSRSYDPARGWLTSLSVANHLSSQYSYNADGQVTSVTESVNNGQGVSTLYAYDNLNRLQSATTPTWSLSWSYDAFGNRTSQTGTGSASGMSQTLGYDATTNRITTSPYYFGIGYDANGNAWRVPGTNGNYSYLNLSYDVFDRLTSTWSNITNQGPSYSYDAFGRRVARTSADGNTIRLYLNDMSGRLLTYWDIPLSQSIAYTAQYTPIAPATSYTYFAGQRVGQWTDRVGSKRADSVTSAQYYPYGEEITGTGNDTFKFAQTYRDADSGLDYAMNRYYASGIGRFLKADLKDQSAQPGRPQSWNSYTYAEGDPINYYDPQGLDQTCLQGFIVSSYGGCIPDPNYFQNYANIGGPTPLGGYGIGYFYLGLATMASEIANSMAAAQQQQQQNKPPVWDIDVGFTPVKGSYGHLFIWVHQDGVKPWTATAATSFVYDGGPSGDCKPSCGNVEAWDSTAGHYNELNNPNMVDFFSTQQTFTNGVVLWAEFQSLAAALASGSPRSYNPVLGPNSNSVAYTLLTSIRQDVGIGMTTRFGIQVGVLNISGTNEYFTGWGQSLP
jgi:RHS repeat-associated protein